jgi:hypothetical protein
MAKLEQDFQTLSQDLNSGNLSRAQQAYSQIATDVQSSGGRRHHAHSSGSAGSGSGLQALLASSSTTNTSSSASTSSSTAASTLAAAANNASELMKDIMSLSAEMDVGSATAGGSALNVSA